MNILKCVDYLSWKLFKTGNSYLSSVNCCYAPDSSHLTHYYEMVVVDCGIVSQNISLFCAGIGLATGPRTGMNQEDIRKALNLKESQHIWLNHPVGYPKE